MEVEDANPPWNARERALIKNTKSNLEKCEKIQVGIDELEGSLVSPEDGKISIVSITEHPRDEGGFDRFVVVDGRRGTEVVDAARIVE